MIIPPSVSVLFPPGGQRILFVQAHPDDADHLCGGTVARLVEEGKDVFYLFVTRGDKGSDDPEMTPERLSAIREQEQRHAAEVHGVKEVVFLDGYFDSEVENTLTLRRELILAIRQLKPDIIFTFDPWRRNETHPDHRAVGMCTLDAVACARNRMSHPEQLGDGLTAHRVKELYYFATDQPNIWIDISGVVEKKIAALRCHESQTRHKDLYKWVAEKGLVAGVGQKLKVAEAFNRQTP
jgi:LmbE family N-acetylglucosaminyl deacetylase